MCLCKKVNVSEFEAEPLGALSVRLQAKTCRTIQAASVQQRTCSIEGRFVFFLFLSYTATGLRESNMVSSFKVEMDCPILTPIRRWTA